MIRQLAVKTAAFAMTFIAGAQISFAQESHSVGTDLRLFPKGRGVSCDQSYPLVSMAYDIEKVYETASSARFKFLMNYGRCETRHYYTKVITQTDFVIQIIADKKAPKAVKEALKYSYIYTAEDEVEVTVDIDKAMLFELKDRHHYTLYFSPTPGENDYVVHRSDGRIQRDPRYTLHFPWHVFVSYHPTKGFDLALTQ